MFYGKFVGTASGKSKNTGTDWYRVDLVAQTSEGSNVNLSNFVNARVYREALNFAPFEDVVVSVGVSSSGHFEVTGIKKKVGGDVK